MLVTDCSGGATRASSIKGVAEFFEVPDDFGELFFSPVGQFVDLKNMANWYDEIVL